MKKQLACLILIITLAILSAVSCGAEGTQPEASGDRVADWTVLLYFCGSDLESKYAYASLNLLEIDTVIYPYNVQPIYTLESATRADMMRSIGEVNILFETGGASKWHAQSVGIDISAKALQRWRYNYYPTPDGEQPEKSMQLLEELPLQSMGEPDTLSDFIRWGAENFPARKYALVLWGHGSGAKTGLLIDELFDNDVLCLYELNQALADSGVFLDTLVLDACMMANIETAWSVEDYARWMVASEETVPGEGTAIGTWLQELVNHPALDGKWLARTVCDSSELKYSNIDDKNALDLLTWSVIDLTKIDHLIASFGHFIQQLNSAIVNSPEIAAIYARYLVEAGVYGDSWQQMLDLGSVVNAEGISGIVDNILLDSILEALSEAVVYISRGPGRSAASGLSFCYPAGAEAVDLDNYAMNFPMSPYMAYLDCISPWSAPDWIYGSITPLPELDTIDALQVTVEKRMSTGGIPGVVFGETMSNVSGLYYSLYRMEEDGDIVQLGKMDCLTDITEEAVLLRPENPMRWLAVEGQLCCASLIQSGGWTTRLYNIPVQINNDVSILRCGQITIGHNEDGSRISRYDIYGIWEGYDADSKLPNRSVETLATVTGQEYRPVYPLADMKTRSEIAYKFGRRKTMPRALEVTEIMLPPGTYFMEYEIRDVFMRSTTLDRIEIHWDGKEMTYPDGFTWEGVVLSDWK